MTEKWYDCCDHCVEFCPEREKGHTIPCPEGCQEEDEEG